MTAALEVGAPPDITRTSEFLLPRWKSQGHLLDITDIMGEMRQASGGINPAVVPLTEESGRNYAVPMGLSPIVFYGRMDLLEKAGYGAFPDTWDKLVEAGLKIQKPPLYAYGMALGHHAWLQRQHPRDHRDPVGARGQAARPGKPPGGELARGGQGLPAHPGHVPEAPDDPPGRPELGQLGEQQGLPGQAGGLRPRQPQHLLVAPHRRQGAGRPDGPVPRARGIRRAAEDDPHRLLRRVQGEPLSGDRQGADPLPDGAGPAQGVHRRHPGALPARVSEADGGPVLVLAPAVRPASRGGARGVAPRLGGPDEPGIRRGGGPEPAQQGGSHHAGRQREPRRMPSPGCTRKSLPPTSGSASPRSPGWP